MNDDQYIYKIGKHEQLVVTPHATAASSALHAGKESADTNCMLVTWMDADKTADMRGTVATQNVPIALVCKGH